MNSKVGLLSGLVGVAALVGSLIIGSSRPGTSQSNMLPPSPPAKTPFQIELSFTTVNQQQTFQVPANRTLIIEGMGSPGNFSGLIQTVAGGASATWSLISNQGSGLTGFTLLQLYADPGSTVVVTNTLGADPSIVNLSGYLTNKL